MPRFRLVQDRSTRPDTVRNEKSSFTRAAIFTRQAKWPAHGIEKTVPLYFRAHAIHPVFFGGRKRESKQVGRSGNKTAAHAQAKRGALEEARRRRTGGGQPLADLLRQPSSNHIGLHCGLNFAWQ